MPTSDAQPSQPQGMAELWAEEGSGLSAAESGEPGEGAKVRRRLNPTILAYLMGPVAFVVILVLMAKFDLIVREPALLWLAVFIAVPVSSLLVDHLYSVHPSTARLHLRVAVQAAGVTTVIYLTGWGPVLSGAFAFLALENVSHRGSRVWRITALWSLVGIAVGQLLISQGWAPSKLSISESDALALMGAFVAALHHPHGRGDHGAEGGGRVVDAAERGPLPLPDPELLGYHDGDRRGGPLHLRQPRGLRAPGLAARGVPRPDRATDFIHPDDHDRVRTAWARRLRRIRGRPWSSSACDGRTARWRDVEAVVVDQLHRPSVAGYVANVRDITERKEFEALLAHRALHDPLTGLANRQLILDRAEQMLGPRPPEP